MEFLIISVVDKLILFNSNTRKKVSRVWGTSPYKINFGMYIYINSIHTTRTDKTLTTTQRNELSLCFVSLKHNKIDKNPLFLLQKTG